MSDLIGKLPTPKNLYENSPPPSAMLPPPAAMPLRTPPESAKPKQPLYFVNALVDHTFIGGMSVIVYFLILAFHQNERTAMFAHMAAALVWIVNHPHFSATNYRLYHSRENIMQYPITALVIPWFILLALVGSIWAPAVVAPYFVKLFMIWSPYHFSGQTVGITLIYARRAGFFVGKWERWALGGFVYGTFLTGTARAEASLAGSNIYGIQVPGLGIPRWIVTGCEVYMYICGAALLWLIYKWCRTNGRILPLIVLVPAAAQYMWFVLAFGVPPFSDFTLPFSDTSGIALINTWIFAQITAFYSQFTPLYMNCLNSIRGFFGVAPWPDDVRNVPAYQSFVPFFHSLQYLLIAWSMQLKEKMDAERIPPSVGYVVRETFRWGTINFAGGAFLFIIFPAAIFMMSNRGGLDLAAAAHLCWYVSLEPINLLLQLFTGWGFLVLPAGVSEQELAAGRASLLFATGVTISAVQIHHFFVDGVIWKLKRKTVSSPLMVNLDEMIHPQRKAA